MSTEIAPFGAEYRSYVHETPGLIHPHLTRSVRVNWEVRDVDLIPDGFPWKSAEGATAATQKRGNRYAGLAAQAEIDERVPRWAMDGVKFLEAQRADSSALLLGLVNQGFVPVKSYAQRRENGRIRLTVVWMDLDKARNHPVAELIDSDQAEAWQHRDIRDAMRSSNVVWDRLTGYNNAVWNGEELSGVERSIDLTFVGRQELSPKKSREAQVKGVVRVRDHTVGIFPVSE